MELPNFDTPQQSDAPAPRKPRQKPTKRRKVAKKKAIVKARKKRDGIKRTGAEPRPRYSKERLSGETYKIIRALMAMDGPMREHVISIAQGLSEVP